MHWWPRQFFLFSWHLRALKTFIRTGLLPESPIRNTLWRTYLSLRYRSAQTVWCSLKFRNPATSPLTEASLVTSENHSNPRNFFWHLSFSLAFLELLYEQDTIEYINQSISSATLLKALKKNTQSDWFYKNYMFWLEVRHVLFTWILTKWGVCFNFNMQPVEVLLNNETWVIFKNISRVWIALSAGCRKNSSKCLHFGTKPRKNPRKAPGVHQTAIPASTLSNGILITSNTTTGALSNL